jgi:hypothetical protein
MPGPPVIGVPATRLAIGVDEEPTHTTTALAPAFLSPPRQRSTVPPAAAPVSAVPPVGTVYSGNATDNGETTDSLTGMILARVGSAPRAPEPAKSSRAVAVLLSFGVAIAIVGIIGGIAYLLAGDFLRALLSALTHR